MPNSKMWITFHKYVAQDNLSSKDATLKGSSLRNSSPHILCELFYIFFLLLKSSHEWITFLSVEFLSKCFEKYHSICCQLHRSEMESSA